MFETEANPFEGLMDESGNLPGDDDFKPEELERDEEDENLEDLLSKEVDDGEEDEDAGLDDGDGEGGDDADADSEDEGDEPEAIPDDRLFDIEIDGETYEVNLPELRTGYLRQEELIKRRTALEAEHTEKVTQLEVKEAELIREVEAYAIQGISDLQSYQNIDWNKLKAEDPEGYQAKRLEFIDKREAVQGQVNRRNQLKQMQEKAQEIKHAAYLESQRTLITELLPDFEKPEFQTGLVKFAQSVGISEEDVRGIADAKQLLVLDMARKYAESQIKKKAAQGKKEDPTIPEVLRPGNRKPPVDVAAKKSRAALSRLRDEQTMEAASAAFLHFV